MGVKVLKCFFKFCWRVRHVHPISKWISTYYQIFNPQRPCLMNICRYIKMKRGMITQYSNWLLCWNTFFILFSYLLKVITLKGNLNPQFGQLSDLYTCLSKCCLNPVPPTWLMRLQVGHTMGFTCSLWLKNKNHLFLYN